MNKRSLIAVLSVTLLCSAAFVSGAYAEPSRVVLVGSVQGNTSSDELIKKTGN